MTNSTPNTILNAYPAWQEYLAAVAEYEAEKKKLETAIKVIRERNQPLIDAYQQQLQTSYEAVPEPALESTNHLERRLDSHIDSAGFTLKQRRKKILIELHADVEARWQKERGALVKRIKASKVNRLAHFVNELNTWRFALSETRSAHEQDQAVVQRTLTPPVNTHSLIALLNGHDVLAAIPQGSKTPYELLPDVVDQTNYITTSDPVPAVMDMTGMF